ncbi:PREDICTED: tumor suppressor candidate 5 homolog [Amphimedon queenslandica]|uniref:Interferon-induced transmembrane protein n=1 Tax=Amphimedon queenslandica TaxID=400682 RepID=A0A1X7SZF9_AMPQE|nr:PREDICTED: tumor suppressor candidate 5 homolog [Amphimedon queenslandica]|eukprot:XP_011408532.1 PREDICTED: tumor suppressor candidate 5 homolog [Amphimedon queenslandica]
MSGFPSAVPSEGTTQQPSIVVIQQPQKSSTLTEPSPDYLGLSICAIFCCWIIAIFAIMKSMETRTYNQSGDYDKALQASSQAKSYSIVAIILGLILNAPPIILIIVLNIVARAN